jgi:hypothetical protein
MSSDPPTRGVEAERGKHSALLTFLAWQEKHSALLTFLALAGAAAGQ